MPSPLLTLDKLKTREDLPEHRALNELAQADAYAQQLLISGPLRLTDASHARLFDAIDRLTGATMADSIASDDEHFYIRMDWAVPDWRRRGRPPRERGWPVTKKHTTKPAKATINLRVAAFRCALQRAARSAVGHHEQSPLDIDEYGDGTHLKDIEAVRRALVDGEAAAGATVTKDYDGERFREGLSEDHDDECLAPVERREESGYIYGLALGILLGRGGAR